MPGLYGVGVVVHFWMSELVARTLHAPVQWLATSVLAILREVCAPPADAAHHRPGKELLGRTGFARFNTRQDLRDFGHKNGPQHGRSMD